jgi:hypothetical protein
MIGNEFPHISQKSQLLYPRTSQRLARVLLQCIKLSQLLFRRVAVPTEILYLRGQLASWMAYRSFWQITIMISNVFSQISHNLAKR